MVMEDNSNGNLHGIVLSNGGNRWMRSDSCHVEVLGLVWCIFLLTSSGIKKLNNLYTS